MPSPVLSVALPTFNGEEHLAATLESILAQSFGDFELLILDDGSRDGTLDCVSRFKDGRVRLHRNAVNLGLPTNMNIAIAMAQGSFLARVDQDDLAHPDRFARQVACLHDHPDITIVGSQIRHFGEGMEFVSAMPADDGRIKARFIAGADYFANQASMGRLDFYRKHHLRFDANLYVVDDLGFWFDCMLHGARFVNLDEPLTNYRVHRHMTSMNLDVPRINQSKRRLYRRLLPTYFPSIDGKACERLMRLYDAETRLGLPIDQLAELHHLVGTHLRIVDTRYGQDEQECRDAFLRLLNNARSAALEHQVMSVADARALDAVFRSSQT